MHVHSSDHAASESAGLQGRHASDSLSETAETAQPAPRSTIPRPVLRGASVRRLQRVAGNQAVLRIMRQSPPPAETIQRQLAGWERTQFLAKYFLNPTLAPWAANLANDWQHGVNILNLGYMISAQSEADLQSYIAAGGGGSGPYTALIDLAADAKPHGDIPQLTTLLRAVTAARGGVAESSALLKILPASATLDDATRLVNGVSGVSGSLRDVSAFIGALPQSSSLSDAADFVQAVHGIGDMKQAVAFVSATKSRGTLAEATKLLATAEGVHRSVPNLTRFVTESPKHASLSNLTAFLAAAQSSKGDLQQMTLLIAEADKAKITLEELSELLVASRALGGSQSDLKMLLGALPTAFSGDDAKALITAAQPAQAKLGDLTNLARAVSKGTTAKQLSEFVSAFHIAGGTVPQGVAFVQSYKRVACADLLALFTVDPKVRADQATAFAALKLKPTSIKGVSASLQGADVQHAANVMQVLLADGLGENDLVAMLARLASEGKPPAEILALVGTMRGTLDTNATSNLGAVTQHGAGTLVLSGQQIHSVISGLSTPGKKSVGYEGLYPTGKSIASFDSNALWTHLDRTALPELAGKKPETAEQVTARRALALAELVRRTKPGWAITVFELYERSGKQFVLTTLREVVEPLCPTLSTLDVKSMIGWLHPLTGDQILELLKALEEGLTATQIRGLLSVLHSAPVNYDGTQIRDVVVKLRGNLAVAGADAKKVRSILTPLTQNADGTRNPTSAGERLLTSSQLHAHLTTRVGGLATGHPVPNLGNLYPTGQDYTALTEDQLWLDCASAGIYQDVVTHAPETPDQIEMRRKLALSRLKTGMGLSATAVQAVFNHDNGQTPRRFVSAAVEDGYAGLHGHTVDSHVLNDSGQIGTLKALGTRVCTKVPQCPERAGAFSTLAQANTAISLINAEFQGAWAGNGNYRHKICTGLLAAVDLPNSTGVLLEKVDEPKTNAYPESEMKKRGMFESATVKNPLVIYVQPVNVHISVEASASAPGGWHVVTAYPSL
jgi:hypothetical protein